jgi:hypothetical protein
MAGLTDRDLTILGSYAQDGNRELYWNYLAHLPGNDGYGLLALGVVRNDNMPGAVANHFAQDYARDHNGIVLSERQWENFGRDLIRRDFEARQAYMSRNQPDRALNLPVADVQSAHDGAFIDRGISPNAWTPRQLLEAARRHGGENAAEGVWHRMLDSSYLGVPRLGGTLRDVNNYFTDNKLQGASYFRAMSRAEGVAALDRNQVDPNTIGASSFYYNYDSHRREWNRFSIGVDGTLGISRVTNQSRVDELNDARAVRLERQEKATQFHPLDPYRVLARSPHTLAETDTPQMTPQTKISQTEGVPTKGSTEDIFMRLTDAAMQRDWAGMRAVTQEFRQSDAGQIWLQSGRDYNQMQQQQAQELLAEQQRQQQQQQAQDAPVHRHVMRLG